MTFDGFWEIGEKLREEARERLDNHFWIIKDEKNNDITLPRRHETEEDAWSAVVVAPFNIDDYKKKGYYAVHIDMSEVRTEILRMKNKIENYIKKGYV